tara:strand:+ start:20 stop:232 length:213 start_codon:yes stop_codon:yes gene_type:complete
MLLVRIFPIIKKYSYLYLCFVIAKTKMLGECTLLGLLQYTEVCDIFSYAIDIQIRTFVFNKKMRMVFLDF